LLASTATSVALSLKRGDDSGMSKCPRVSDSAPDQGKAVGDPTLSTPRYIGLTLGQDACRQWRR
jgi:hypothetical protein